MVHEDRERKAKLNIVVTLVCQFGTIICAFLVPQWMLTAFGSEVYGATTSISQFLAYITLLEGGIGGVARAALYKPLADNDTHVISCIVNEIQKFFRVVAGIFFVYVIILAASYKQISHFTQFSWGATFCLVVAISLSTFAEYFIGITYSVLIQAAQRTYVINFIKLITTMLNTILVFVLIRMHCDIIQLKLVSSVVFILRPILINLYARRLFEIEKNVTSSKKYLTQKWTGLGQHIAFFLYSNTDVAVLTLCGKLKLVAVYSIYNMVNSNLQNIISSFSTGMEAVFGDMIARSEIKELNDSFTKYETMISFIATVAFSTAYVLIVPFVRIYTSGINDANYIDSTFAFFIILSSLVYCIRQPYHATVMAAGHFKQTKMAAYSEALVNILLSVLLVRPFGLTGIAFGTLTATSIRLIFYVVYLSKNICNRPIWLFIKRIVCCISLYVLLGFVGNFLLAKVEVNTYLQWVLIAVPTTLVVAFFVLGVYFILWKPKARKN